MKNPFLALIVIVCLGSCQSLSAQKDVATLEWLVGTWKRTDIKNKSAHERWVKVSANELQGWGVTQSGEDTTFVEKLKILPKDGEVYYVADVIENPNPVFFKIISLSEQGFTCENKEHDFPKKIEYFRKESSLTVVISGDGRQIEFEFIKQ